MRYEVTVDFDDSHGDVVKHRAFFSMLDKYADGIGTGHSNGTSSMEVLGYRIPSLRRDLENSGIKLLEIRKLRKSLTL